MAVEILKKGIKDQINKLLAEFELFWNTDKENRKLITKIEYYQIKHKLQCRLLERTGK